MLKDPSVTSDDVIVIVGDVPSYVQLNWTAAELPFPAESVKAFAATSIVVGPSPLGVNVAL